MNLQGMRRTLPATMVFGLTIAIALTPRTSAYAQPKWYDTDAKRGFKTDVPDFYQHQYIGDKKGGSFFWEVGGGWCRPTAIVDCLYYWKSNGYDNLLGNDITKSGKWQQAACDEILNVRNLQSNGFKDFLQSKGHGEKAGVGPGKGLTFTQYNINQTNGKVTYRSSDGGVKETKGTAFDLYQRELLDGQDVMIRWAATDKNVDKSLWWRGPKPGDRNYHYVTGAGIDVKNREVYFADPDSNKGNTKADAGWNGMQKDDGVNGRKYVSSDANVPIPERGDALTDDPKKLADFYGKAEVGADGFTLVNSERYTGVTMYQIETICPLKAAKAAKPRIELGGQFASLSTFDISGGVANTFDSFFLFPTATVDMTALSVSGFVDPSGDLWSVAYLSPGEQDPDGNIRSFGGVQFSLASGEGLMPGEFASATLGTLTAFDNFDLMGHVKGSDNWLIEAIGASEDIYDDQIHIQASAPEPAVILLLTSGLPLMGIAFRWRRRS